jgi:FAD:protein FMN transferase
MHSLRKFWFGLKGLSFFSAIGMVVLVSSCTSEPTADYLKGDTMGTFYTLHFWSEQSVNPEELSMEIDELLHQFENELSNWKAGSWINQFNAMPVGESLAIPEYAYEVLRLFLELAERSDGMLDPTLSPLIELWGFGTHKEPIVPDAATIQRTLQMVGYQKLVVDFEQRTLSKRQDGLQLNCSAVAKGYAVDLLAKLLEKEGIENFLINIGGEVTAKGTRLDRRPWSVGISQPALDGRDRMSNRSISLSNQSLATSGHSQRTFLVGDKRYSHILNPKTGQPVSTNIASATVLAPSCALADGLATLALILDENQMETLLKDYPNVEIIRMAWEELTLNETF